MFFKNRQKLGLLLCFLFVVSLVPLAAAGNLEKTYTVQPGSPVSREYSLFNLQPKLFSNIHVQKLYVSIPPSLVNYYGNLTHTVNSDSDYAQFVTPQAVLPIAEAIRKVTDTLPNSNEQFADAVLALVHQIPYNVTDIKYPVETIVDDEGDCVGLSLLAASIMEAGGLNVVLIHYTGITPQHMNVGVYLPYTPVYHTTLMAPTSFTYDNKTYWTAEATPGGNWKVGDQSPELATATANIIPLNNTAQSFAPAEVSASLNTKLVASAVTVNLGASNAVDTNGQRALTISGSITPAIPGQSVTLYISGNNNLTAYSVATDDQGNYSLTWNFTAQGTYYVTANWNGASNYAGSDSQTVPVFIGPQSYIQFDAQDYNYIYGEPSLAAFATEPMQGVNDFLTLPLGTNASLSYSFIVLPAGQTISNVGTENVTVPASQYLQPTANGKLETVMVPAHNETVPVDVPNGLAPLKLPDDFNQTLDNQFCFLFQNTDSGNYSFKVRGLSDDDLSNMQPSTITNATANIQDGTWYQVTANISDNTVTATLSLSNGTQIANIGNTDGSNQTVLLVANNEDSAVVIKNLDVQSNNVSPQPQSTQKPAGSSGNLNLTIYVCTAILLTAALSTALYIRKLKKNPPKK